MTTQNIVIPAPSLPDFLGSTVVLDELTDNGLAVSVHYEGMAIDHTVRVRWRGNEEYYTNVQTVTEIGPLTFVIPKSEVEKDLNNPMMAKLSASVGVGDNPVIVGEVLKVTVVQSAR